MTLPTEVLVDLIKTMLKAKYTFWVLLSNGTYIVLDETVASKQKDLKKWVLELLEELRVCRLTVFAYTEDIVDVPQHGGWIVTNNQGIYTYVHPSELTENDPSELAISVKGCQKYLEDCVQKNIIHIQRPAASHSV